MGGVSNFFVNIFKSFFQFFGQGSTKFAILKSQVWKGWISDGGGVNIFIYLLGLREVIFFSEGRVHKKLNKL